MLKAIALKFSNDLQVFSTPEYENAVSEMPSVSMGERESCTIGRLVNLNVLSPIDVSRKTKRRFSRKWLYIFITKFQRFMEITALN
jgi:hypothetical protein